MKTDVLHFTDYRAFLKAHAQDKRKASTNWSYGLWARQLKLKGTASLTMVVNGQRKPGPKLATALSEYFKFNQRQRQYFTDLIRLEKFQEDARLKVLILEELKKLSPDSNFQILDEKTFTAISTWYFYAIRQMTRLENFDSDPKWIKQHLRFPVTEKQIRKAIEILLELKLLKIGDQLKLVKAEGNLHIQSDVASEAIRRFHKDMISHALESVDSMTPDERELKAFTLSIRQENLQEAREMIRKFANELSEKFGSDQADSVYQLNVQFFPLTHKLTHKQTYKLTTRGDEK